MLLKPGLQIIPKTQAAPERKKVFLMAIVQPNTVRKLHFNMAYN